MPIRFMVNEDYEIGINEEAPAIFTENLFPKINRKYNSGKIIAITAATGLAALAAGTTALVLYQIHKNVI